MSSWVAGYHVVDVDFISRAYTKGQSGTPLETLACNKLISSTKMVRIYFKHSGKYVLVTIVQEFGKVIELVPRSTLYNVIFHTILDDILETRVLSSHF